jgi:phosphohistidine phosphatase
MFVYLVQHAAAQKEAEDPKKDLTAEGRMEIENVSHHLKRLGVEVQQIFHSGKTRASSTAKILAWHLKPPAGVSEAEGLAPLDDPKVWADRLAVIAENVMLVGHLPHLAKLAALLMTGDQEKQVLNFQMAGAVRLKRLSPDQWTVDWMVLPEILL